MGGSDSYYSGQPPMLFLVNNLVIASLAANTSTELAVTGLTGVALGDVGFVIPTATPVVGCEFTYFRGTGDDAGVIGIKNVSEGALDFADTQDVNLLVWRKPKLNATVTHS